MPDYKQLYLTLLDATEKSINELVSAQRACEELLFSLPKRKKKQKKQKTSNL